MNCQRRLTLIMDFLNLEADSPFLSVANLLQDGMLCRYILSFANSNRKFSLLTREEVSLIEDSRDSSHWSINRLRREIAPVDENVGHTILTRIATKKEGIIFPEDIVNTGIRGHDMFVRELFSVVEWFRIFMAGCESGRMDIGTLNEFKYTKGVIMEFKLSRNPMNPALSVAQLFDTGDDIIERKLLCNLIYPFLFSGQGNELSKVRRCRNCGRYFLGKRISATFCGSKCRGTFYYAHSDR